MIILKDFPIKVITNEQYNEWLCPGDMLSLGVSDDRTNIEIYDKTDKLVGVTSQEDTNHIMPLLTSFSYAAVSTSVEMNYDEDGGHTLFMHVYARINTYNQTQRNWLQENYP